MVWCDALVFFLCTSSPSDAPPPQFFFHNGSYQTNSVVQLALTIYRGHFPALEQVGWPHLRGCLLLLWKYVSSDEI